MEKHKSAVSAQSQTTSSISNLCLITTSLRLKVFIKDTVRKCLKNRAEHRIPAALWTPHTLMYDRRKRRCFSLSLSSGHSQSWCFRYEPGSVLHTVSHWSVWIYQISCVSTLSTRRSLKSLSVPEGVEVSSEELQVYHQRHGGQRCKRRASLWCVGLTVTTLLCDGRDARVSEDDAFLKDNVDLMSFSMNVTVALAGGRCACLQSSDKLFFIELCCQCIEMGLNIK